MDEEDDERDAAGVDAAGSTDSDSGAGAEEADLQWARNGESDRDLRCRDRPRTRPRLPAFSSAAVCEEGEASPASEASMG